MQSDLLIIADRPGTVAPAPPLPPLRALMSMPCAAIGVGQVCRSLLNGTVHAGYRADLFTSRSDGPLREAFALHSHVPWPLSALPHRLTRRISVRRTHAAYFEALREGDIAYLWPSVPRSVYAELRARGVTIVAEAINTRMQEARPILDAAYARLGLPPTHRITDDRIADEEARLALTDVVFSPSPATDASFRRSVMADRFLPASYGVDPLPADLRGAPRPARREVRFLFVGLSSIRKGLQDLLEAWRDVPRNAHLRIIGLQEPELFACFPDVFAQPNVSVSRFVHDLVPEYRNADVSVLPSLEEGDPIATYEAASWGLPVVASPAGAGRIGAETGAVITFDTSDIARLRQTIAELTLSRDMRADWGARALAASAGYGWTAVAARRMERLSGFLGRAG